MFYACKFENCLLVFDRPGKLKRHEECHLGIKSFVCTEQGCSKSYHTSSHLKRHINTYHSCNKSESLYVCSFESCDATFNTTCGLQKHEKKHLFSHLCNLCNRFFNDESYQKHTLLHQNKGQCSKKTSTASNSQNASYWCEDCCLSFVKRNDFVGHCQSHQPVTSSVYCGETGCHKEFKNKRNLKEHIMCCHMDLSLFICGEAGCTRVFAYKKNLKKHILTKHLKVQITCPVENCKRTFLFRKSLNYHLEQHERNLVVDRKKRERKCIRDMAKELCDSLVNVVA